VIPGVSCSIPDCRSFRSDNSRDKYSSSVMARPKSCVRVSCPSLVSGKEFVHRSCLSWQRWQIEVRSLGIVRLQFLCSLSRGSQYGIKGKLLLCKDWNEKKGSDRA
jgi:hypothetical protein